MVSIRASSTRGSGRSRRSVAVADVYDALRSERPYKRAYTVEETLGLMSHGRGSHFGPGVYDAFAEIAGEFEAIRQRFAE